MTPTDVITQYFVNILQRRPSSGELMHWSAMVATGQMSLVQVRDTIAASPEAITFVDQIIRIYQAAFGRAPDPVGLNGWTNLLREDPTALSKVALGFVNSTEWMNRHGNNSVSDAVLQSLYQNVLGRIPSQGEIDAWKATGQPMTQILIGFSNSAEFQTTSAPRVTEIKQAVADRPLPPAPVETPKAPDPAPGPANFTLTKAADTYVGDDRNNTIDGIADGSADQTFTAADSIDGGAGTDTLKLINTAGTMNLTTAPVVRNVETLELESSQNTVTADVRTWAELQTVRITQTGTKTGIIVETSGNVTALTVTGGLALAINDRATAGGDKLSSVSLDGYTANSTIQSDALTSLSLANSNRNVTISAAAGPRTLDLTLNAMTGGTISDTTMTALNVTGTGSSSSNVNLTANALASVTFAGNAAISMQTNGFASNATITSTNTAGVNLSLSFGVGVTFTGGSGADSIGVGATTSTLTMGDGADRVRLSTSSLGTGGSIDGGAGRDTLVMGFNEAAVAAATTTFSLNVKNFEVLEFTTPNISTSRTVNIANLNSGGANTINTVTFATSVNSVATLTGLQSGGTVEFRNQNLSQTTVNVADAATGLADVLNIGIAATGTLNTNTVNVANVETINYLTDDTAFFPTSRTHNTGLVAAAATKVTVTGDAGLNLTFAGTAVTSFDASGVTHGNVTWTTAALTNAATIKGGAGNDSLNASAATQAVTIEGGNGNDTIQGSNQSDTLVGGAGNDVIDVNRGADMVDVGAGNDSVRLGAANTDGSIFPTITGMGSGDTIRFITGTVASFQTAAVTAGGSAGYTDLLNAATNGLANRVVWFQFGGDTYLVQDRSDNTTFANGTDAVVKLVGLYDLSTATIDGATTNLLTLGA
ncbi:DUF4214 domain-containing protein [Pannonibacter tanglangensis]|uniref:DUF4214 domain-containing protein n=1 Tax=Pannonibacter tanglangensis TaxID=2750084 RepID=A0ABW9ZIX1_9HYPH|nr:DUF4214 domain-containing protein [Pannonibacter sp. XCT-34]NBN63988.1 DUF4214 domain-containing protein [Pannonibacter sp. XCT-34]